MFRLPILSLLLVAAALVPAGAQNSTSRADAASRTAANLERTQAATTTAALTPPSQLTEQAEFDLGEQLPVRAAEGGIGLYGLGDTGLFYTSNPSLANGGGRGDLYFFARGAAGLRPQIAEGLYLDAHFSQEVFQYAHFSSLNFTRMAAGGGLDYVIPGLGGLTATVRFEYERFLDGRNLKEFYVNNAIYTGLSKEFAINDAHAIQLGWQSAFSVTANPSYARRNEHDFWVGWRWQILEPLELQTYYILSLYYYPNEPRTDVTNNVGGSLIYSFTPWARLSASANFGANNSTDSFYDYTVVNVGGAFGLDFRF